MAKASRSGITITVSDVPVIKGMVARGDRRHDIAAWFGLNQGRIKEVEDGDHGSPPAAASVHLPPSGSPGPRAQQLRASLDGSVSALKSGDAATALMIIQAALKHFDRNQ